jgi:hypothetical protein
MPTDAREGYRKRVARILNGEETYSPVDKSYQGKEIRTFVELCKSIGTDMSTLNRGDLNLEMNGFGVKRRRSYPH